MAEVKTEKVKKPRSEKQIAAFEKAREQLRKNREMKAVAAATKAASVSEVNAVEAKV
jgi:hypothetical protein